MPARARAADGSSDIGTGIAENCRVSSDECTLHYSTNRRNWANLRAKKVNKVDPKLYTDTWIFWGGSGNVRASYFSLYRYTQLVHNRVLALHMQPYPNLHPTSRDYDV